MYFYSHLDAGDSCLPGVWQLVGTWGSHRCCSCRVSAQGCRDTHPPCTLPVMFVLFSLCITSYYHSFATSNLSYTSACVLHHTVKPCLSPAPLITKLGQNCQVWWRQGWTDRYPPPVLPRLLPGRWLPPHQRSKQLCPPTFLLPWTLLFDDKGG